MPLTPPTRLTRQALAAMILDHPFSHPPSPLFPGFDASAVVQILAAVSSTLLPSPRSVGRQEPSSGRHRSPLKPRRPHQQVGPAALREPSLARYAASKALHFYSWAAASCGFEHCELTCRAMARVLARANALGPLWQFLKQNSNIVTTKTVTDIIKFLGEEGLINEALAAFYRMRQLHCKPDTQCYNTVIAALCRVGDFKKARFLLCQMELPGARCPPDSYTYTVFITHYCKRSMQTGCRKAIRRRIWEANHMFRHMKFKGFEPDVVTYNCLIDGLCKTYRIERAHELFDEMTVKGCLPNRLTYNSFVRYYSVVNDVDKAIEMMRMMVSRGHGFATCSSYTPIIHSLVESGRASEARDFLAEMVDGGSTPREFTYKLVCDALEKASEEGLPMELRRRIENSMDERYRRVMQVKPIMSGRNRFIKDDRCNMHVADA